MKQTIPKNDKLIGLASKPKRRTEIALAISETLADPSKAFTGARLCAAQLIKLHRVLSYRPMIPNSPTKLEGSASDRIKARSNGFNHECMTARSATS